MEFELFGFLYEGFYNLRLVIGMMILSFLFLKNERRIKLPYIILSLLFMSALVGVTTLFYVISCISMLFQKNGLELLILRGIY